MKNRIAEALKNNQFDPSPSLEEVKQELFSIAESKGMTLDELFVFIESTKKIDDEVYRVQSLFSTYRLLERGAELSS